MRPRAFPAALFALLLSLPASLASAAPLPLGGPGLGGSSWPLGPGLLGHDDPVFQHDADGNLTVKGLLDDHPGGSWVYTRVALPGLAGEAAGALGAYEHRWWRQWAPGRASPMTTVGVFHEDAGRRVVRLPLVLFENVTHLQDAVALVRAIAEPGTAQDPVMHLLPFLLEAVEPAMQDGFASGYPPPGAGGSQAERPPVYAWLVRKAALGHEAWLGLYAEHRALDQGQAGMAQAARGERVLELGLAARYDRSPALPLAGVWMRSSYEKQGEPGAPGEPQSQQARSFVAAGVRTPLGHAGLLALEATDARRDTTGDLALAPDHQETGLSVGVHLQGQYVPVLGARTTAEMHPHDCPPGPDGSPPAQQQCLAYERLTTLGVYLEGSYVPLAGFRYRSDRSDPKDWLARFVQGGGPGSPHMGSLDLDVGAVAGGAFAPLAGARYRERFPEGVHLFQGMLSAGIYAAQGWRPLLGVTWDGARPAVPWAQAFVQRVQGRQEEPGAWMASAGTFLGQRYVPVVGARFVQRVPGAEQQDQGRLEVGAFLASYQAFVPLLVAAGWDQGRPLQTWLTRFATGGTLGSGPGGLGLDALNVGVRYRDAYGSQAPAQGFVTIGVHVAGSFTPVVGVAYAGQAPLLGALNNPADPADDGAMLLTAGVFVQGAFVPVVGLSNDAEGAQVGLLPGGY